MSHNPSIRTYWYPFANFGDQLTAPILEHFGIRAEFAEPNKAEAICIGSILQRVPQNYSGWVVGAGLIRSDQAASLPLAKILALRGKLTKARTIGASPQCLGDMGLLADLLLTARPPKKWVVGLIPHYIDKDNPMIVNFAGRYCNEVKIIDVQAKPKDVVAEIASCEFVISSSLHGLVAADSLAVPNVWIVVSNKVNGWGFKFFDYFSAFNHFRSPEEICPDTRLEVLISKSQMSSDRIGEVRSNLIGCISSLKEALQESLPSSA